MYSYITQDWNIERSSGAAVAGGRPEVICGHPNGRKVKGQMDYGAPSLNPEPQGRSVFQNST